MKLKIITPNRVLFDQDKVASITAPTTNGYITILDKHQGLFTMLEEGIVSIKEEGKKDGEYYAIGGGYLKTDGKETIILVNRAFGQNELNEKLIEKAIASAKQQLNKTKSDKEKQEIMRLLNRSLLDRALLAKLQKKRQNKAI
ncbi:MAG: hypothetical protein KatS3mg090_0782 [Patescibacteria group bacterium]|nr:MAG: hypothetical protein KatS3mg090_0782 [Patescibacteria group bacterium]